MQLARASGLEVISTASAHNHDFVKSLGASEVFDHRSKSVIDGIVAALKGKRIVGAFDCISEGETQKACADILYKSEAANRFLSLVFPATDGLPQEFTMGSVFATTILSNGVATTVWGGVYPQGAREWPFQARSAAMGCSHWIAIYPRSFGEE